MPIVKHVTKMGTASAAVHLGPQRKALDMSAISDWLTMYRSTVTRPSCA
eukprot:CAMPEP_0178442116 /NCGR_PEP_ID=MMETSP0689_2-20121128/37957_1 /TAXON_ID=160604 /ORGANISM="Amphidinium massartii, Strain CS-259" /LENGTH=48 /DNA_ID= /DNA_START= /DNA_END= /DNA_ORIENTATION=